METSAELRLPDRYYDMYVEEKAVVKHYTDSGINKYNWTLPMQRTEIMKDQPLLSRSQIRW